MSDSVKPAAQLSRRAVLVNATSDIIEVLEQLRYDEREAVIEAAQAIVSKLRHQPIIVSLADAQDSEPDEDD